MSGARMLAVLQGSRSLLSRTPFSRQLRCYSEEKGGPVKYTTSKAAQWRAEYSRSGAEKDDSPWFQPYVVIASVAVFLVYFTILREESDIDNKLGVSLYERIEGLEESQLMTTRKFNLERGRDTRAIEQRLEEIRSEKRQ